MRLAKKLYREVANTLDKWHTARLRLIGPLFDIHIGPQTVVRRGAILSTRYGGSIRIGGRCHIESGARLDTYGGDIVLGERCSINFDTLIYGHGGVTLGEGVHVAAHTVFIPANHKFDDPNRFIYQQGETRQGITVQDDVWIATQCTILDGVTIGRGCVIGAGAVVSRSTEPMGVYVGVPARRIRDRGESSV